MKYTIERLGGACPLTGCGTVGNRRWYFRARGQQWSMSVGPAYSPWKIGSLPTIDYSEFHEYGDTEHAASWMPDGEAREFICEALTRYAESVGETLEGEQ